MIKCKNWPCSIFGAKLGDWFQKLFSWFVLKEKNKTYAAENVLIIVHERDARASRATNNTSITF